MCSQSDDPTTYSTPRTYKLSGDAPEPVKEPASVALAVLGEMLDEYEGLANNFKHPENWRSASLAAEIILEARRRVAEAEAWYDPR